MPHSLARLTLSSSLVNPFRNDVCMVSEQLSSRTWSLNLGWGSGPVGVVVLVYVVGGFSWLYFGSGPVADRFRFVEVTS